MQRELSRQNEIPLNKVPGRCPGLSCFMDNVQVGLARPYLCHTTSSVLSPELLLVLLLTSLAMLLGFLNPFDVLDVLRVGREIFRFGFILCIGSP